MLSRRHARIFSEEGVVYLADLDSRNGTTVPKTIIHVISAHTGRWKDARFPCSETRLSTRCAGNVHQGCTTAQKIAQMGQLVQAYTPALGGKKTKEGWSEYAKEMHAAALELADAAKSKQDAAITKASQKLTASCTRCHDIFR